jgi:hypothetical protein
MELERIAPIPFGPRTVRRSYFRRQLLRLVFNGGFSIPDSFGGSIKTYVGNFVPGSPPISENVLDFLHSSVPGGPPIREGAVADFVHLTLDGFQPSGPPIHEGFTDGLHDIIDLFHGQDGGGGLGDFILF